MLRARDELNLYQKELIKKLFQTPKFGLFLDLGLGKSIISLMTMKKLYNDFAINRTLIIAPRTVAIGGWSSEIDKWEDLKGFSYHVVVDKSEKQRKKLLDDDVDIHIINQDMISWLVTNYAKNFRWDFLILDESTSIKNPSSKRFKQLKRVQKILNGCLLLSATPISNGYMGLWSQIYMIDGGRRLGINITEYRRRYFYQAPYCKHKWLLRPGADKEIQNLVADCTVWLKNSDYVSLPNLLEETIYIDLPEKAKAQYKELEESLVIILDELWLSFLMMIFDFGIYAPFMIQNRDYVHAVNRAVLTNKLNQFCSSGIYNFQKEYVHIHDEKLKALKKVIESEPDKNHIVVYWYKFDKENIEKLFPHAQSLIGDVEKVINDWNDGKIKLLLLHPMSGSKGLNLQYGGHRMIFYTMDWDLEGFEQIKGRLLRRGQKSDVKNTYLITRGGMDEKILKALKVKFKTQREFLEFLRGHYG